MLPTSRRILRARAMTSRPAGVIAGEALALAREQLHAELGFELLQLLADAGLARVEPLGRRRDVQAAVRDAYEIFELFERHAAPAGMKKAASSERVGGLAGPI